MKKFILLAMLIAFTASCTKEVPESEKKIARSTSEKEVTSLIDSFVVSFNSGIFEKMPSYFTNDYGGYTPDSDTALGPAQYKNELQKLRNRYPDGKLQVNVENVYVSEDLAAVQTFSSFMTFDPIEGKLSPLSSERSLKLLRKTKNDGWKIFKSLSVPAFSY